MIIIIYVKLIFEYLWRLILLKHTLISSIIVKERCIYIYICHRRNYNEQKEIYQKVAKECGVSVQEVKQEMQTALKYAYGNTPDDGVTRKVEKKVPSKAEGPTP